MNIAVIGGGALGLLLTARLTAAGSAATLVVRTQEQAEAVVRNGVRLAAPMDSLEVWPGAAVFGSPEGKKACSQADWIMVAVKQPQLTDEFLSRLAEQAKAGSSCLLFFQNGIGHIPAVVRHLPRQQVRQAVTTEGALKLSQWEVQHTGRGVTWLEDAGCESTGEIAACSQKKLADLMNRAGFAVELSNNMEEIAWGKLLVNAVVNPLTALLRVRNGELLSSPSSAELMRRLAQEAWAVGRTGGSPSLAALWDRIVDVCENTRDNRSSMLQDIEAGRATEIDAITGSLIREAAERGVPVPGHETLYSLVKSLEERRGSSQLQS